MQGDCLRVIFPHNTIYDSFTDRISMEFLLFAEALLFFVIGLILGSFFNVLIYRLPEGKSIVLPGSYCPACKRPVRLYENIPILSYIFLRGRCAGCNVKIPLQYPLVEAVTALLTLVLWYTLIAPFAAVEHLWWDYILLALQFITLLILIPVSVIDFYHYIIPDSITLSGLLIGIAVSFIPGGITPQLSLLGGLAGGGTLILIGLFGEYVMRKKDAMGGGDIKLLAFIGVVWGWKIALLTIVLGALLGSCIGVLLIMLKILERDKHIPFGPFLGVGAWTAFLFGETIIIRYSAFIEALVYR